jgi:hypothetical protein
MPRAAHVVAIIDEIDVDLIIIPPTRRERPANHKPVASITEARTPFNNYRADDYEAMVVAKAGIEVIFWNVVAVVFDVGHVVGVALALMFAPFVFTPFTPFMALKSFMPLAGFMAFVLTPFVIFVPLAGFSSAVLVAFAGVAVSATAAMPGIIILVSLVPGIAIMIVLCKRRNGRSHCERQERSNAESN